VAPSVRGRPSPSLAGATRGVDGGEDGIDREAPMRHMALVVVLTLGVGVVAGAIGRPSLMAQSPPVTRTTLQQRDLDGIPGRELLMYRADFIPGGALGRHFHPGPELIYVLEGELTLEQDGHSPVTLKVGDSAHLAHKHIHKARNPSSTGPARVLVFLVGEKGQPIITLVH
jgi:quercetin dioxygenase-like cupin family protein